MKLTRHFQKLTLLALASVLYMTNANADSWYRHIYNKTDAMWGFKIKSTHGNFYANCESNCTHGTDTYKNTNFTVYSGETWKIHMTTTNGAHQTEVGIANQYGSSATYCFTIDKSSIYAQHNGNTGSISLNTPANADVNLLDANAPPVGTSYCSTTPPILMD